MEESLHQAAGDSWDDGSAMRRPTSPSLPVADRPHMPEYGILPPEEGRGLLPWRWAAERLAASHNDWLATTCPDGRAHLIAVWGASADGRLCFSTARSCVKARNLRRDPRCVVSTESGAEAVIAEGSAEEVNDAPFRAQIEKAHTAKYGEGFQAIRISWPSPPGPAKTSSAPPRDGGSHERP